jgi:hypothetical protein
MTVPEKGATVDGWFGRIQVPETAYEPYYIAPGGRGHVEDDAALESK